MIDPNDLMIGNYAINDGIFYKVTLDTFRLLGEYKVVYKGDFSFSVKNDERIILEPIEIAKYWLVNLGCSVDGPKYVFDITTICHLVIEFNDDETVRTIYLQETNNRIEVFASYVHEIQNLYYLLTKQK